MGNCILLKVSEVREGFVRAMRPYVNGSATISLLEIRNMGQIHLTVSRTGPFTWSVFSPLSSDPLSIERSESEKILPEVGQFVLFNEGSEIWAPIPKGIVLELPRDWEEVKGKVQDFSELLSCSGHVVIDE